MKLYKNFMDNMGQSVFSVLSLDQNLLETIQNSKWIEFYVILTKINQSLLNGQYGSTRIFLD